MTWSSSRSCPHRTVNICFVHGSSARPPARILAISARSQPPSAPTVGAILRVFGTVLTYSGIPRRKAADFADSSVTNAGSCCRNVEPFGVFKLVLSASVLHLCSSCCWSGLFRCCNSNPYIYAPVRCDWLTSANHSVPSRCAVIG